MIDSPGQQPTAERSYDYRSDLLVSASAALTWRGHRLAQLSLSRSALHTFTRTPADHVLARYSAVGRLPVARGLHLVVEGDRVARTSTVHGALGRDGSYSEVRAGLAWTFGR